MPNSTNEDSSLQGITRLITDATIGVTDIVEAMHQRVVHPPCLPSTPIQHLITKISGFAYNNVRFGTKLIGGGLDKALGKLQPLIGAIKATDERDAYQAALNGVIGDYLAEKQNPLAIQMAFRHEAQAIALDPKSIKSTLPNITDKILLMVHGSSMNDRQWTCEGHNHGATLAKELGMTPIYLRYNSGQHISTNGQELNELLETLTINWPVPVEQIHILAHSMGGLVSRSAVHYAQTTQRTWLSHLQKLVFLGTPHHGARLERAGNYLDVLLASVPYAKPFARLGKIRSAGITDLRYGNITDEAWEDTDRFELTGDPRQAIPLPPKVAAYSVAAVLGDNTTSFSQKLVGDGLVDIKSALGQHTDPTKDLHFKTANTHIALEHSHLELLSSEEVYGKLLGWMR